MLRVSGKLQNLREHKIFFPWELQVVVYNPSKRSILKEGSIWNNLLETIKLHHILSEELLQKSAVLKITKKFSGHTFYEFMNPEFEKTMQLDAFLKENCSKTFQKPKFAVVQ